MAARGPKLLDEELDALFRITPAVLHAIDAAGHITHVSDRWLALLGYERDEVLGHESREFLVPQYRELAEEWFTAELLKAGTIHDMPLQAVRKNGEIVDMLGSFTVRRDAEGAVLGVITAATDVTEQRSSERRLAALVEFQRSVLDSDLVWVSVADDQGRLTFWNHGAERISGYGAGEVLGTSDLWEELFPDADARGDYRERYERLLRGDAATHGPAELRIRTRAGEERTLLLQGSLLRDEDGHTRGLLSAGMDITARKHAEEELRSSEQRFRELFHHAADAMVIHRSDDLRIVEANLEAVRRWGYSREELLRMSPADLDDAEHAAAVPRRVDRTRQDGSITFETVHRCKDGRRIETHVSAKRIEYDGVPCVFAVARDISERKQVEEQLRQAQKMEAVGQLAGGVAHDFNNLLQGIGGYVDLSLADLAGDPTLRDNLLQIKKAAGRAAALTRQLLTFSRRERLRPRYLDLNDTVADLTSMLHRILGEHIELRVDLQRGLGTVHADPNQIEQVVVNLCVNARDAMPEGGTLTIETADVTPSAVQLREHPQLGAGDRLVQLVVRDTGAGIPPEHVARVFEPFFTTKEVGEGTGLGLATVYATVHGHGGAIEIETGPGEGTAVRVLLPSHESAVPDTEQYAADARHVQGNGETVLVAEDEEIVRRLAARVLERAGYRVLLARDGVEAVELASRHTGAIDLALVDAVMPHLGGSQVQQELRARALEIPVLFCTGYSRGSLGQEHVPRGADVLHKPYTPADLLARVRAMLER